ncbi:MAG: right-handed parallel beta-helix repeat-containing protein, partial [Bacteroidales bacterium]|nr:right-handed parallel beta-helix repeat-containing protein [Bacteroidales bacterium]
MKQIRIFALIALAVLTAACAKEIRTNNEEQEPSLGPNVIVFTANAPSKTAIDSNDETVTWVAGDEVRFSWDGGYAIAAAASSGATTTFTVEVDDNVDEIYAVYPASAGGSVSEGKVTVHYSGSRTDGTFEANDICVARAVKSGNAWNTSLAFKNAACVLKIGVTSSDIVKIRVEAVGGEVISGAFEVSMDGSGNPVVGDAVGEPGTMSRMDVSGPGNYYIPIKPGVTLTNGFRVSRFTGESDQVTPFYYNGEFITTRGQIIKIADIDSHAGQYYVTPNGAGSKAGQSWSNAMSAAQFKTFVENQDNHFLLKGSTFHFSAEEFSFGDDYVKPNYPDHANVIFTIEGTVTPTDTTTFLGRTATSGTTAGVLWPQANSYLTVKNVKFTGTNGASNASAIRINNGAVEVNLDHCYFRNNQTSGNGGSISLFNSATVTIKNCSFSGNIGAGGLIHVNNTSANVIIQDTEVKGCSKNAVYAQSAQAVTLTRVTFKDNDDAGEYGAAAFIGDGNSSVSFVDCDFLRNHST